MSDFQPESLQAAEGAPAAGLRPDWQPPVASFLWALAPLFSLALVASHYGRSRRLLAARNEEGRLG